MVIKNKKSRTEAFVLVVAAFIVLAGLWAVSATPDVALGMKPGGDKMFYWVGFPEVGDPAWPEITVDVDHDPLDIFWNHQILGRAGNEPAAPRILVNRVWGGEEAHMNPKNLRLTNGFSFIPGADGGDDFDIAFQSPDNPNGTYNGTLNIKGDGLTVTMSLTALSRTGKKQSYTLTAEVDPAPTDGTWDPMAMAPGEVATVTLGAWELKAGSGGTAKGVHAWGDFSRQTQITILALGGNP